MSEELKTKQLHAAQLLLSGCSTLAITSKLGICAETLYRWKKLPEFKALIDSTMAQELLKTQLRVGRLVDNSLTALGDSISPGTNHAVRLKAALSVLKLFGIERIPLPDVAYMDTIRSSESEPEQNAPDETPEGAISNDLNPQTDP